MINRENEKILYNIFNPLDMELISTQCSNSDNDFYTVSSDKIIEVNKSIVPIGMNDFGQIENKSSLTESDYDLLNKYISNNDFKTYLIDGLTNRGIGVTISIKVENELIVDSDYTDSVYIYATKNTFIKNDFSNLKQTLLSLNVPEDLETIIIAKFDSTGILNAVLFQKLFSSSQTESILSAYKEFTPYKIDTIIKMIPKESEIIFKLDLNNNIDALHIRKGDMISTK